MSGKAKGGRPGRYATTRVRTARGRKSGSTRWLGRQLNDPYVAEAKKRGYRSRAAFKLIEIDEAHGLLKPGQHILDLGAAPGGWSQVAAERIGAKGRIVAVDLLPVEPLAGVITLTGDLHDPAIDATLAAALGGPADLVLSDMAAATTGHRGTDHLRTLALAEAAAEIAFAQLRPGGDFLTKLFQGGETAALLALLKQRFATVRHVKPPASRADSSEIYLLARGHRPAGNSDENLS